MREYFSHDYNARNDQRIVKITMQFGLEGIGIYWCLIEILYECGGYILESQIDTIAFELRTQSERIADVLNTDLFKKKGKKYYSESVLTRLSKRKEKSEKARQSAVTRWNKETKTNANVMRTHSDSNAIKVKESKVKEIKERELLFTQSVLKFDYPKPMLDNFISYWTEPNKSGTKMLFELKPTWDTKRRLKTWADRDNSTEKPKSIAGA